MSAMDDVLFGKVKCLPTDIKKIVRIFNDEIKRQSSSIKFPVQTCNCLIVDQDLMNWFIVFTNGKSDSPVVDYGTGSVDKLDFNNLVRKHEKDRIELAFSCRKNTSIINSIIERIAFEYTNSFSISNNEIDSKKRQPKCFQIESNTIFLYEK
jgi:hypothetical protein